MAIFKDGEIRCIKQLAKFFEQGHRTWANEEDYEELGLTKETYVSAIAVLEMHGAIENVEHNFESHYQSFTISPMVVQIARQIEEAEVEASKGKDIVEQIKQKTRSSPSMAWIIIIFFILVGLATLVNQTIQILQNLGWIAKP